MINSHRAKTGFTLLEILIVIAIIAVLATITFLDISPAIKNTRDKRRKLEITQIGRFLVTRCYVPDAGAGEYDLATLVTELKAKYPQYANVLAQTPRDPSRGTAEESFYRYVVNGTTKKCALYANLEDNGAHVTIPEISAPTPGSGTGVFEGASGWNNSNKYFQFSN